jgi:hypothetical protein
MDMGIKVRITSPRAQIRWHEKSVRMDIVQHAKDNGDIDGTIEVTAAFVYARSLRLGRIPLKISSRAVAVQDYATGHSGSASWLRADRKIRRHTLIPPAMPEYELMPPTKSEKLLARRMRTQIRSTHRLTARRP